VWTPTAGQPRTQVAWSDRGPRARLSGSYSRGADGCLGGGTAKSPSIHGHRRARRHDGVKAHIKRCFPRCSRFGPEVRARCYTACRALHRFAAICTEAGAESRASIGLADRRKWRRGLEFRPEEKTPQAVRACSIRSRGNRPTALQIVDEARRLLRHKARPEGLEPPTLGSEDRCSIRLSYGRRLIRKCHSGIKSNCTFPKKSQVFLLPSAVAG
jgi:hypothetical protein